MHIVHVRITTNLYTYRLYTVLPDNYTYHTITYSPVEARCLGDAGAVQRLVVNSKLPQGLGMGSQGGGE